MQSTVPSNPIPSEGGGSVSCKASTRLSLPRRSFRQASKPHALELVWQHGKVTTFLARGCRPWWRSRLTRTCADSNWGLFTSTELQTHKQPEIAPINLGRSHPHKNCKPFEYPMGSHPVNGPPQMHMSEWLLHCLRLRNKNATRNSQEGCLTFAQAGGRIRVSFRVHSTRGPSWRCLLTRGRHGRGGDEGLWYSA